jgi:hypothetical protein
MQFILANLQQTAEKLTLHLNIILVSELPIGEQHI